MLLYAAGCLTSGMCNQIVISLFSPSLLKKKLNDIETTWLNKRINKPITSEHDVPRNFAQVTLIALFIFWPVGGAVMEQSVSFCGYQEISVKKKKITPQGFIK